MFSNQFDDDEHSKYGMSAAKVKYWMDDSQAPRCMRCSCEFSAIIRRHHCRKCGEIICDDCCKVKLLIPLEEMVFPPEKAVLSAFEQDAAEPQKVCSTCAMDLLPLQTELQRTIAKAQRPEATALDRAALRRYFNAPFSFSLADQIKKASYTLLNFTAENQLEGADTLPRELLWEAEGIAILTFVKAGFFFTGRFGTGLVVGRLPGGGWSAPSAVASSGVGWGFQIGGEVTDVVVVLNTRSAVEAFTSSAQVSLGTELSVSVGPLGRGAATDVRAGDGGVTAAFSYAHSRGLFVGVSLEAAVLTARDDINEAFYGHKVSPKELLLGMQDPPPAARPLYEAIAEVINEPALAGGDLAAPPSAPPADTSTAAGLGEKEDPFAAYEEGGGADDPFAEYDAGGAAGGLGLGVGGGRGGGESSDRDLALRLHREELAAAGVRWRGPPAAAPAAAAPAAAAAAARQAASPPTAPSGGLAVPVNNAAPGMGGQEEEGEELADFTNSNRRNQVDV